MNQPDAGLELSIVVPVYRSATILPELVRQVREAMAAEGLDGRFELILVNDASPDDSWPVIRSLAAGHGFLRGIHLRKNVGQHNATIAGLHHARGRIVAIMDDDLQHPPDALGDMVRALDQGHDVCYTRYLNRQHRWWRQAGSRFNDWVATRLLGKPRGVYLSSFKALRREIVDEVIKYDGPYTYLDGLILDVTHAVTAVDVVHRPRHDGKSTYTLRRLLSLWAKMATSFSILPLRLASYLGFLMAGLSLAMVVFVVVAKFMNPDYPQGWASLIAAVLFIGGVQTLCIGMIGEYLGRAYLKLNGRPQFVIGTTTWTERGADGGTRVR
ncbi:glycosyltransferase family 2 protein [Arenimonas sp.]|uniref:glycosyltransferase family 2 protein n=1 Tax=Arenimonas sp. TaxID=1872635 RepID=UPI002E36C236|nr:glycosyltransferase family 2 protein [Arenimonas sp.]HEX4854989.1 glycosyltransferase family 2 protein [Arenimonas sp.]